MKTKKWLTALAGTAVVAVALTGCSNTENDTAASEGEAAKSGEPITLEMWAWASNIEKRVDAWNAANPDVQVRLTKPGGNEDVPTKIITATRAGEGPDIAQAEYGQLPSMVISDVAREITDDYAPYAEKYAPAINDLVTFDGAVFGVPQDIGPTSMMYRHDIFDEYGFEVPTTWEEFAEVAEDIRAAGDGDMYIANFAGGDADLFVGLTMQAGANWWTVDGDEWKVDIDSQASRDVLAFWQDMVDRDLVSVVPGGTPEWNSMMNDGKILTNVSGVWAAGVMASIVPDTIGKWKGARTPEWTPGVQTVGYRGGSVNFVTTSSEHPKEAAEVILWLNASDEGAEGLAEISKFPAALHGQDSLSTPPALMPEDEEYWPLATEIAQDTFPIQWGPNPNVAFAAFTDEVGKALTNGTSVVDALPLVQKAVVDDLKASGFNVAE